MRLWFYSTMDEAEWTEWFSEEGDATGRCPAYTYAIGLACKGSRCDSLRILCSKMTVETVQV